MPVIFQERNERVDLKANPENLYVFGDNESRRGMGGQTAQCRGTDTVEEQNWLDAKAISNECNPTYQKAIHEEPAKA